MHILQMFITIVVMVIGDHLLRLALEAHAFSTLRASHTITSVCPFNREFAIFIRTPPNIILSHEFLEGCRPTLFCFITGDTWMIVHFALQAKRLVTCVTFEISTDD